MDDEAWDLNATDAQLLVALADCLDLIRAASEALQGPLSDANRRDAQRTIAQMRELERDYRRALAARGIWT